MSSMAQRELIWFFGRLMELQMRHEYSVTSWLRTYAHNVEVGGLPHSLHLIGLAVDCVLFPGRSPQQFLRDAQILGLHGIVEGDHIHLQARARVKP